MVVASPPALCRIPNLRVSDLITSGAVAHLQHYFAGLINCSGSDGMSTGFQSSNGVDRGSTAQPDFIVGN